MLGLTCDRTELPQEAHNLSEGVAEGEAGEMSLESSFSGLPHPAEHPGDVAQAESSLVLETVGACSQSEPHSGVSGMLGITAEGGETPNSAGKIGVFSLVECAGGGKQAAALLVPDPVGISSRSEPSLLIANVTATSVPREGSAL